MQRRALSRWVSVAAALKIAKGILRKTFLVPEQLGIVIRSNPNPVQYCLASFIKMETDSISEININANLLGTQTGMQLGDI